MAAIVVAEVAPEPDVIVIETYSSEPEVLSKALDVVEPDKSVEPVQPEKGIESTSEKSHAIWKTRFKTGDAPTRAAAVGELAEMDENQAFSILTDLFDDESEEVRNNAARALFDFKPNRADSFTRALREASPERRKRIAKAMDRSGLAEEAVSGLAGKSREITYDSFSLLFLMAKAGETAMLLKTIEQHSNMSVQLSVIKLLTFSNQPDIVAKFRSLAVKGALPPEVRSAVMESIYQMSSNARESNSSVH